MTVRAHRVVGDPPALRQRESDLRHNLRAMLGEGAASSAMVGLGETYFPAFVLALGLGQVASGLVTTMPLLAGSLLQLITPWAVRRLGSHRRWVVACTSAQAASFLPLAAAAFWGHMNLWAVFAVVAVYWGTGMATAPAWSTWVDTLVPGRIRAQYFSRRTRIGQLATLLGFVVGGVSLQIGAWADQLLLTFGLVFLGAAACRFASALMFVAHSEPEPTAQGHQRVSLADFCARLRNGRDGRLLLYLLSVQAAAQIAGPYFTPYMLRSLEMSYGAYVSLIAVSFAAKALALPAFGTVAHRFGSRKLLWIGGLGIVPISSLWLISSSYWFLFCVQIAAGVTWAAYELAMFLLFFEAIRPEERTSVLTSYNLANAVATAAGSLLGAGLLAYFGRTPPTYLLLFALSSAARGLAIGGLVRVGRGVQTPRTVKVAASRARLTNAA